MRAGGRAGVHQRRGSTRRAPVVGLRDAMPADAPRIAEIQQLAWRLGCSSILAPDLVEAWAGMLPGHWQRALDAGRTGVVVAQEETGVVGFCWTEAARLRAFFLHPEHWGSGVAELLFRSAAGRCGPGLFLLVPRANLRACRFYEKQGLRCIAEMNELFFDYEVPACIYTW